jgi:3-phosphoshikimate 1-carboxyvinyltransferase
MRILVKKSDNLQGVVKIPGSKSQAIRALFFALLAQGTSVIENIPEGEDLAAAQAVLRSFGAQIHPEGTGLRITSQGLPLSPASTELSSGNSGITTRFMLPLLGLRAGEQIPLRLTCGEQMQARPMGSLLQALRELGMDLRCLDQEGSLPVEIRGTLRGGSAEISGITSQFLSALLIALPLAPESSEIRVRDLHERPYVEMTLAYLQRQGIRYLHEQANGADIYKIPGGQQYHPMDNVIAGDYSNASYFMTAGLIGSGKVILEGLDQNDPQGDRALFGILERMGADIQSDKNKVVIQGGKALKGIAINANAMPDLLPTLAVLGTQAEGKTEIYGVPQARLKETDRIHSMTEGLRRMGARIEEKPDGMVISPASLRGAEVKGYGDHRTVMALTLAGLWAEGETLIDEAESIHKTYPRFFDEIKRLGGQVESITS